MRMVVDDPRVNRELIKEAVQEFRIARASSRGTIVEVGIGGELIEAGEKMADFLWTLFRLSDVK